MADWETFEKKVEEQIELLRYKIKCFKGSHNDLKHLEINLQTAEQLYEQVKENELRNRKY